MHTMEGEYTQSSIVNPVMVSAAGFETLYTRAGEFRTLTFCMCIRAGQPELDDRYISRMRGRTYGIGTGYFDPAQE